jgi:hypothetical protein
MSRRTRGRNPKPPHTSIPKGYRRPQGRPGVLEPLGVDPYIQAKTQLITDFTAWLKRSGIPIPDDLDRWYRAWQLRYRIPTILESWNADFRLCAKSGCRKPLWDDKGFVLMTDDPPRRIYCPGGKCAGAKRSQRARAKKRV